MQNGRQQKHLSFPIGMHSGIENLVIPCHQCVVIVAFVHKGHSVKPHMRLIQSHDLHDIRLGGIKGIGFHPFFFPNKNLRRNEGGIFIHRQYQPHFQQAVVILQHSFQMRQRTAVGIGNERGKPRCQAFAREPAYLHHHRLRAFPPIPRLFVDQCFMPGFTLRQIILPFK